MIFITLIRDFRRFVVDTDEISDVDARTAVVALYSSASSLELLISAALKTAQGSSTVAIVTTASIMAPMLATLGLDPALTVIAIGAGSMVVSHANDSYFWVVSQFSGMPVNTAYKAYSSATAVEGIVAFATVFVLSLFV